MQSDGVTTRSELEFVKAFFVQNFGVDRTKQDMIMLREILKRRVPVEGICAPLRQTMPYQTKLQLMHYLFGVAYADGTLSENEKQIINRISLLLGVSPLDLRSIGAMFIRRSPSVSNSNVPYEILGISPDVTDEEVKRAYRKMALENHPDKVTHLGEDLRIAAEEKFKKIQEAYEEIKSRRGFA